MREGEREGEREREREGQTKTETETETLRLYYHHGVVNEGGGGGGTHRALTDPRELTVSWNRAGSPIGTTIDSLCDWVCWICQTVKKVSNCLQNTGDERWWRQTHGKFACKIMAASRSTHTCAFGW